MSPILPIRPGTLAGEPEPTSIQDPRREMEQQRRRWEVRAAQWRALEIAREIWGDDVSISLSGYGAGSGGRDAFRGLLHVEVPLAGANRLALELHRERETDFSRAVGFDPLLRQVPLVYIFAFGGDAPEVAPAITSDPSRFS